MSAAPLAIERLTPSRRDDYLRFFDHERGPAFRDNPDWARCYCHYHQVSPALDWEALDADANRVAMAARIDCAEMEGYLAYRAGEVVGWLNAQPRNRLRHCDARIGVDGVALPVSEHEAAAIVCFVVPAHERRGGIARALLAGALADLARRGIRIVDAYPRNADTSDAPGRDHYRGPRALFAAHGFADIGGNERVRVLRKRLTP
ncbi:MAG TPA: GNAT family N-acetyltransferase [Casimicrobiaceae bacterium]|jgi:GNAT superfamily N-acetyltransferase|nr:GNAT family N-acetyltransferase [Casimicrobiaceae bacterium]